jgi:hypothetical protein
VIFPQLKSIPYITGIDAILPELNSPEPLED